MESKMNFTYHFWKEFKKMPHVHSVLRLVMSKSDVMNFYSYDSFFYAVMRNEILAGLV